MHKYISAKARHFAGCPISGEERSDRDENDNKLKTDQPHKERKVQIMSKVSRAMDGNEAAALRFLCFYRSSSDLSDHTIFSNG